MASSPFTPSGKRAIDLLKAESAISTPSRRVLRLKSGAELEFYVTPITLAQRKAAAKAAGTDEQLEINLQLLVMKARDVDGNPLFTTGELPDLRRAVSAGIVAELVGQLYEGSDGVASDEDLSPKPSPQPSAKTNS